MKKAITLFAVSFLCLGAFTWLRFGDRNANGRWVRVGVAHPIWEQVSPEQLAALDKSIHVGMHTGFTREENGRTLEEIKMPDGTTIWSVEVGDMPMPPER